MRPVSFGEIFYDRFSENCYSSAGLRSSFGRRRGVGVMKFLDTAQTSEATEESFVGAADKSV